MPAIPKTVLNKRRSEERKAAGLVKREAWVRPEDIPALRQIFPSWPMLTPAAPGLLNPPDAFDGKGKQV